MIYYYLNIDGDKLKMYIINPNTTTKITNQIIVVIKLRDGIIKNILFKK